MAVTYRVDLGESGTLTWHTSAEDMVDLHENAEIRRYVEGTLRRMILVFLGTARGPSPAAALGELDDMITSFAKRRIDRIHQLDSN